MVKLQKHKAYTYKSESGEEIEHYKHLVVIPEEIIQSLGWNAGTELIPDIKNGSLMLRPESKTRDKDD